jgi:hypothetical protein
MKQAKDKETESQINEYENGKSILVKKSEEKFCYYLSLKF